MTILFAGGEDVCFTVSGTPGFSSTTAAFYRSAYSRGYCQMNNSGTYPPGSYIDTGTFTAQTDFWVHGQAFTQTGSSLNRLTTSNQVGVAVLGGGVARLLVRGTGTDGIIKLSKRNSAGTITDLATASVAFAAQLNAFDMHIVYGTSGSVDIYMAGVLVLTYSGDVTTDSATTLDEVWYAGWGGGAQGWSECIVASERTMGMALQTLPPVASGATQDWTPNTVGNINTFALNDGTFVSSASADQVSLWTVATTLPSGGPWEIKSVVQYARLSVGTSGPQTATFAVRNSGGTNYTSGSVSPLTGSFSNFSIQWTTNPGTGSAWAAGELTQAGVKSLT